MFRLRSEDEYAAGSDSGVRNLFSLGPYEFHDTLDADGVMHHFILEPGDEDGSGVYEVDHPTMYEFLARYVAGLYEMEEYELEHSVGHDELLDVLEMATARARAGESGFTWEEFDKGDTELLNGDGEDVDSDEQDEEADDSRP